jgi:membrane protease subunit HflC
MAQRIRARADRERRVLLAEARKEAQIARGEGDAEAVRIFAEAYGEDIDFFTFYRSMQAYRDALGDENTSFVLSPDSEFFRFFGNSVLAPAQDARAPASPAPAAEDRASIDAGDDGPTPERAPDSVMVR